MIESKRHDFECCKCGHEMQLAESIAMEHGLRIGHGSCLKCKTFLHFCLKKSGIVKVRTWKRFMQILNRIKRGRHDKP